MVETDVCVIGAGVMGLSAAYWLIKTPSLRVVILDQYGVPNEHCSSNDANRVFRYAYGNDEFYTRMARESLGLWKDLERETRETLLVPTGLLLLHGEDAEANKFNEDSYNTLSSLGLGAEMIGGGELRRRYPKFSAQDAILDPHGGVLLAARTLSVLAREVRQKGVRIFEKSKATKLSFDEGPVVETSLGEEIQCRSVIVAAGPWSNQFRREDLPPMTPTRQQIVYFRPKADMDKFGPPDFPVFFADQFYGLPAVGIDGVKVSHKNLWDPVDPDQANRSVSPEFVKSARTLCSRFVPELATAEAAHTKVCLYDMTKNSDFVIGHDPEKHGVVYAYGFSGHGFKFAPLIGKTLAELTLGKPTGIDIERLAPSSPHETQVSGPPY